MTQHTPGPWELDEYLNIVKDSEVAGMAWIIAKPERGTVRSMCPTECDANARLIAEAGTVATETGRTPRQLADLNAELLEALKDIPTTCDHSFPHVNACWVCKVRRAIAKAEGRSSHE